MSAIDHLSKLRKLTNITNSTRHLDVAMKLFALYLEDDAFEWRSGLPDNSFSTWWPHEKEFLKDGVKTQTNSIYWLP